MQAIIPLGIDDYYDISVPGPNHYYAEGFINHNCGKTHVALSKFSLTDYFCFPDNTLILISSTDIRGLELRVWGDLKDLFGRAKEVWPEAPGNIMDSMHGVFTDELDEENKVRDIRKGIICIPCVDNNGAWRGMTKLAGLKQKRRRLLADEFQLMQQPYLATLANLNKGDFKFVCVGNPIGEGDPLDKIAEPVGGWDSIGEITQTTTWKNRMGGTTIQLYGPDSPAIRHPGKYTYLVDQADIDYIINYWGKDSPVCWNQAYGARPSGTFMDRVLTRSEAVRYGAMEPVVWRGKPTTKGYAIDAGYGGDRCIGGAFEYGEDINGNQVLLLHSPKNIPIKIFPSTVPEKDRISPEDQIAEFVKNECAGLLDQPIPARHVFHDATGRGSLGTSFARIWNADTNPVEFGGTPSDRPVSMDLFKLDEETNQKRLIRCNEMFGKRVTQYWFQVRFIVEGRQMRGLQDSVIDELSARKWTMGKNGKRDVETKDDCKARLGRSPDLGDWCAICCEGAIRLGFRVSRLTPPESEETDRYWMRKIVERSRRFKSSYTLDVLPA